MKTEISFSEKKINCLEAVYKLGLKIQECYISAISFSKTNSSIQNINNRLEQI